MGSYWWLQSQLWPFIFPRVSGPCVLQRESISFPSAVGCVMSLMSSLLPLCHLRSSPSPKCGAATSSPCTVPSLWRDTALPPPSSPAKSACARSKATSRFCRSTRLWLRWGSAAAGGYVETEGGGLWEVGMGGGGGSFTFTLNLCVTFLLCMSTDSEASSPELALCINRASRTLFRSLSFLTHLCLTQTSQIQLFTAFTVHIFQPFICPGRHLFQQIACIAFTCVNTWEFPSATTVFYQPPH